MEDRLTGVLFCLSERDTGVLPDAMTSADGWGSEKAVRANATDIMICMATTHHRFVLMISTNGLHKGLITHGRYRRLVYIAISPFDILIFVNMITDMVFTMK